MSDEEKPEKPRWEEGSVLGDTSDYEVYPGPGAGKKPKKGRKGALPAGASMLTPEKREELMRRKRERDAGFYSIPVDPDGVYGFTEAQRKFILAYVETHSVKKAASSAGMTPAAAKDFFQTLDCKAEVRRVEAAERERELKGGMMTLDEIGAWLSALIRNDVPDDELIDIDEKFQAAKLIINIHGQKQKMAEQGQGYGLGSGDVIEIKEEINSLTPKQIKNLIAQDETERERRLRDARREAKAEAGADGADDADEAEAEAAKTPEEAEREDIVAEVISAGNFSDEEIDALMKMPLPELRQLLKQTRTG